MKKKTILFIIGGILVILIVTNPSVSAFKDHLGAPSTLGMERKYNFFVCSIFRYDTEYIGVLGNFIEVKAIPDTIASAKVDTSGRINWIYSTNDPTGTLYSSLISAGYTTAILGTKDSFTSNVRIPNKAKNCTMG